MKRVPTAELLDTDAGSPGEVRSSLRDLDRVNRWFGGVSTSQKLVTQVARATGTNRLSILEVAAGSGETSCAVRDQLTTTGIGIDLTLLDRASSHLAARERKNHQNGQHCSKLVVGDALHLPFEDASFDVLLSNLFLHHLNPEQVLQFVDKALRVCRYAVVVNDISRSSLHLGFVYAGFPLFRSRITRNDAPASVRQSFTLEEMRLILSRSKAARVDIWSHYLFRIGAIVWKKWPTGNSSHV